MNTVSRPLPHIALPELDEEFLRRTVTTSSIWNDARRHGRTKVQARCVLVLEPTYAQAGREAHTQEVHLQDISRSGVRFIHAAPLFPGEHGKLVLPKGVVYRLEVVWCRRIAPGIFMSGGQFVSNTSAS